MGVNIRFKNLKDNRQSIYLDIIQDNQRRTETLKGLFIYSKATTQEQKDWNKDVLHQAEKLAANKNVQLLGSTYDFIKEERISFLDLFKQESDKHYARRGCKSNHYCCFKHLIKFTGGKSLMYSDLTEKFAEDFQEYLLKNLSTNCSRTYMGRFRRLILLAVSKGYLKVDITANIRPIKEVQQPREYLTAKEVKHLSETPCKNELVKRMFLFSCFTGLRISDLKAIRWSNVRDNKIIFNPVKTRHKFVTLYLSNKAQELMGERTQDTDKVFKWQYGESNRYDLLREWIWKDAGINRNITWHSGRHTAAILLLEKTKNIRAVQQILGHERGTTTERYAKMLPHSLEEAMYSLDEIY